ncbi:WG repeat-containing protein [Bernardetia sp. ABR2-2B]|uniref:WG repeat-containing protein n=1 Tax=Bernardetia sp. ABR2-2B TaxID=3127472 RepID=UPI0030CBF710
MQIIAKSNFKKTIILFYFLVGIYCINPSLISAQTTNEDGWETATEEELAPKIDTTIIARKALLAYGGDSIRIASIEGKLGVLNDTNATIVPFQYEKISFFEGEDSTCTRWEGTLLVKGRGKYGVLDPTGKPLTALYEKIEFMPETCQSASGKTKVMRFYDRGKVGLADAYGNVVIRPSYEEVEFIKYYITRYGDTAKIERVLKPELITAKKAGKYGLFDLHNNVPLLRSEYNAIDYLQDIKIETKKKTHSTHILKIKQGTQYGFITLHNKAILVPQYEYLGEFSTEKGKTKGEAEDLIALVQKKGKWGWINLEGKEVIKVNYDAAEVFRKDIAFVRKGRKWTAINRKGKQTLEDSYEEIKYLALETEQNAFFKTLIIAKKKGKYGILDIEGKTLLNFEFDKLTFVPEKFGFNVEINGEEKFVNLKTR